MSIITVIAVYFVLWWLILFAVLPFGVKRDVAPEEGNDPGAPVNPMLLKKFIWTSIITAIVTAGLYGLDRAGLLTMTAWFEIPADWPGR